ncbi:EAL domain-containing protein [Pseudomonas sp. Choline-3u-10]|jgi:EAL domain-containing protein (putative c-di-GMP-specific phosphodiesterase class I)|uniref:S6 modification regulatory phosphodiesterase RimA n=1 Tax=Pseudomonadaceae TaxID=135621 RepID=UPI0006181329|nr:MULTISPECIES: EAL domain-containing protein [Pseudomonadaceae]MAL38142.1 EAL domain-containing protein [Pseudomonas sp.]MBU0947851.1 EAL domain-containing protein [Gammaproteobacteria bacterium]KJJ60997.1 diguanylate phosphodiesterase [Pseudomonas sp. 10B238]MBK3796142.1 EAL domain-containing protein [Stutzerimonas stutzeri]MBK3876645.1 EAL domain-containing protein [Stutzerimonas stutzeri]|tara:strand:+ start:1124 stop:1948 length:825 start_codon:yes stop_codon:yes gene_type:complete
MIQSNTDGNPAPSEYSCHSASEHGACPSCASGERLGFRFSYAYQPIVDISKREIFAHEALVRGVNGEPAPSVLSQVTEDNRFRFDQACRVKAIKTAAKLNMQSKLSINFMPNAIYRPELCIRSTLEAARAHNFPIEQIIFETVEGERISDAKWLTEVFREYQRIGFLTAIDDFGAGFAGLNLLADFQPDLIKLDMDLIRSIDQSRSRQAIVRGTVGICNELGIQVIAEGVETPDEYKALRDLGISLMQGYLFSKPLFESCSHADSLAWPGGLSS